MGSIRLMIVGIGFVFLVLAFLGEYISYLSFSGYLCLSKWQIKLIDSYVPNLSTEFFGLALTVLLVDVIYELRNKDAEKKDLILMLGSNNNMWSQEAARRLRARKWTKLPNAPLRGADLSQADLSGMDLRSADLYQAELDNTNLSNTNLRNANLGLTTLQDADLSHADLRAADLSDADCVNTNFTHAILYDADLTGADLSGANLRDAKFEKSQFNKAKSTKGIILD